MHNEKNKTPRKGPMGPNMNGEKAKNFKSAVVRLLKELKGFQILISASLILAALGAILSILAPDHLSNLVNKISEGLVINKNNMEIVTEKVMSNMSEEKLNKIITKILSFDMSSETIQKVMISDDISIEDKELFQKVLKELPTMEKNDQLKKMSDLPNSILNIILPTSTYKENNFDTEILVLSEDKQQF
ncbi:MAG: hypothetical protein HFH08_06710, partial [Bacilli bacterium]|nr:hypothetical protein [Bacilli bacterium]